LEIEINFQSPGKLFKNLLKCDLYIKKLNFKIGSLLALPKMKLEKIRGLHISPVKPLVE